VRKLLKQLGVESQISHGLVQTAYANSRSSAYLKDQAILNQFCKTGVKYAQVMIKKLVIGA
jgi:hypothetical protein